MQHLLDLARPYWPLILALVVWPLVSAALTYALWWDTPARWDAFVAAHPRAAFAVRILRAMSPHLRKLVIAWRDLAASRSALPLSALAEKAGALVVSETRGFTSALSAYELDHPQPPHPTPRDGVAFDVQRRTLGAVTVDPRKSEPPFDPTARQTIVPEVAAQIASETLPRDPSQRGSISLRALLAIVVGLAVVLPLGVGLYGCPRNPPVSGCQPEAQTCINDRPHVCSASQRWHVAGDRTCSSIGGVCTVLGGRAYCGPVVDAGADVGDAE